MLNTRFSTAVRGAKPNNTPRMTWKMPYEMDISSIHDNGPNGPPLVSPLIQGSKSWRGRRKINAASVRSPMNNLAGGIPRYEKLRPVRDKPTSRNRTHFDQRSHFRIGRLSGSISV